MPVLKTQKYEKKFGEEWVRFSYKVSVNADGEFTTTLPEEITSVLKNAGIETEINRNKKDGFFRENTLEDLNKSIDEVVKEAYSRELISTDIVIRYVIDTFCAYCISVDGEIVPNGSFEWTGTEDYEWKNGTVEQNATYPKPFGLSVWARPFFRYKYIYKTGREQIEYKLINSRDSITSGKAALYKLSSFATLSKPRGSSPEEIEYTEDTAEFFVNLLTSICAINERIKDKLKPDVLKQVIESKQRLLG